LRSGNGLPAGGDMRSMAWANEYQGFLVHNTAVPVGTIYRTNNGGYTWEAMTTPTNVGLNHVWCVSASRAYVVGEVSTTSMILKVDYATPV